MASLPETHYAKSGDINIAYQVTGTGPRDMILVPGWVSHLENDWEEPGSARFLERLGSFCRLIRFDKRGTGLSDRPGGLPDLETRMDDVRAVMDATDSSRAVVFGYSEGGPMSVLFAATYPSRTESLVLYGSYAKRRDPVPEYPWAPTWAQRQADAAEVERTWAEEADLGKMAPNADEQLKRWWRARARASASPGAARDLILMNSQIDVRHVLPTVSVPTLVLHRRGDRDSSPDEGRYIAAHIPGARFVLLEGDDHPPYMNPDPIIDEIEEFVTGIRPAPDIDRMLATVVFTDIVGSTEKAAQLGDRDWGKLLDRHHHIVRQALARFRGREVDTAGDGFLATFDGPARADPLRAGRRRRRTPAGTGASRWRPHRRDRAGRRRRPWYRRSHRRSRRGIGRGGPGPCFVDRSRPRCRLGHRLRGARRPSAQGRARRVAPLQRG